ncbi:MAG: hypothetical protein K9J16_02945 [Melioribacteraceae bacterium]|nr:hypothetical protein [Melioribacteraceae bacterium]MCF8355456.1 hypothetical protein [Melioribacteraceae bacterium]MCF8392567.1 hypothetical protein [Melioribacteraceae bacterium]MCF8418418.1 hypothetical protein [Melioribacteraceae bacterium]
MSKVKQFIKSPHIQIAMATGICIIILAIFSKRILPNPIGYLPSAIPPFLMVMFEIVQGKLKEKKKLKVGYWITAIFSTTAIVIILSWQEVI